MMRLPRFRYLAPASLDEAVAILADLGAEAAVVAGGTDLFPNMKRRQQTPGTVVGLRGIAKLRERSGDPARGITLGALTRLSTLEHDRMIAAAWPALSRAASLVATPPLRNMGTLGGNLCLDTRCSYYDQGPEWRAAIGYCMKKDGDVCWVAPSSPRCWAVSSSDTAPVAIALGATVLLTGANGDERELPVAALYQDDGIDYMAKRPEEVVTRILLPVAAGVRTAYVKLRRRGSIDFPIAGAGVALKLDGDTVEWARVVLSAAGALPVEARAADEFLSGRRLDGETIAGAAEIAAKPAKPLDNADLSHFWRKRMVRVVVEEALRKAAA